MTSPFEKKKRKKVLTVLISIFIILFIAILGLDSSLKTQFYQLDSDKISGRLRIALVSDLHSCAYGEEQDELIQAIVLQKPDLVLLCGDICDDILPRHNTEALLKGCKGSSNIKNCPQLVVEKSQYYGDKISLLRTQY